MDTDKNLLFGVLALHIDLIDRDQFTEACAAWATNKTQSLGELLKQRGWIDAEDHRQVDKMLDRKLARHKGNVQASLAEVVGPDIQRSLMGVDDTDLQQSLTSVAEAAGTSTINFQPAGETRSRYRLGRLHGEGGLGRVWLAHDDTLGREVALKEIRKDRRDARSVERFAREARITGQIEHPGIVPVYDFVDTGDKGAAYYTMRLIHGRTLTAAIADYHAAADRGVPDPLEFRRLLNAFVDICQALAYAHSRGVIHRDLKPDNVVLGPFGEVVVLDWGLARTGDGGDTELPAVNVSDSESQATQAGTLLGTPAYMAPEQAAGKTAELDHRTDVYGLGAILFQILSGRPPVSGIDTQAILDQVLKGPTPRASQAGSRKTAAETAGAIPPALDAVAAKAMAKAPADRYGNATTLADDVSRWLADEPVSAFPEPVRVRVGRWMRRHQGLVGGIAAGFLLILTSVSVLAAVVAAKNGQLAAANARERTAREKAVVNRQLADKYGEVALATLGTVVSEYQRTLSTVPRSHTARKRLLALSMRELTALSETLSQRTTVDRNLIQAHLALGEIFAEVDDQAGGRGITAAMREYRRALSIAEELERDATDAAHLQGDLFRVKSKLADGEIAAGNSTSAGRFAREVHAIAAARIEQDPSSPERRADLAHAHYLLGRVYRRIGKTDQALQEFSEQLKIAEALVREDLAQTKSEDLLARMLNQVSLAYQWSADANIRVGKLSEAARLFEKRLALLNKLLGKVADPDAVRRGIAESNQMLAVTYMKLRQLDQAESHGRAALALNSTLYEADPRNLDLLHSLADAHQRLGLALQAAKRREEAYEHFKKDHEYATELFQRDPDNAHNHLHLAIANNNVAGLALQLDQIAESGRAAREAVRILEQRLLEDPKDAFCRRELAIASFRMAGVAKRLGDSEEALAGYAKEVDILVERARSDPANAEIRADLLLALNSLGKLYQDKKQHDEAAAVFRELLEQREVASRQKPDSRVRRRNVLVAHSKLATIYRDTKDYERASAHYDQALQLAQTLAREEPAAIVLKDLNIVYYRIALQWHRQGKSEKALEVVEAAIAEFTQLMTEHGKLPELQAEAAKAYKNKGILLSAEKEHDRAADSYLQALNIVTELRDEKTLPAAYNKMPDELTKEVKRARNSHRLIHDLKLIQAQTPAVARRLLLQRGVWLAKRNRHEVVASTAADLQKLAPVDGRNLYNVACLYCLASTGVDQSAEGAPEIRRGYQQQAVDSLLAAAEHGWRDAEHTRNDPDLEPIRELAGYTKALDAMTKGQDE